MLRESRELENVAVGSGGKIDRAEMISNLERQHELKKTIQTLEGRHRRAKNGLAEVGRSGGEAFEDGEESSDGLEAPEIALVGDRIPLSKAKGKLKSTKLRRDEVKSGSQFLDAEEERVREHIEQSLADGLDKLVSLPLSMLLLHADHCSLIPSPSRHPLSFLSRTRLALPLVRLVVKWIFVARKQLSVSTNALLNSPLVSSKNSMVDASRDPRLLPFVRKTTRSFLLSHSDPLYRGRRQPSSEGEEQARRETAMRRTIGQAASRAGQTARWLPQSPHRPATIARASSAGRPVRDSPGLRLRTATQPRPSTSSSVLPPPSLLRSKRFPKISSFTSPLPKEHLATPFALTPPRQLQILRCHKPLPFLLSRLLPRHRRTYLMMDLLLLLLLLPTLSLESIDRYILSPLPSS